MPYKKIDPMDYVGKKFNRFKIEKFLGRRERGRAYVLCKCQCGIVKEYELAKLIRRDIKSCGCYAIDILVERSTTHGLTNTPEYKIWKSIRRRCFDQTHKDYKDYGGRGITMCDEWKESFQAFYDHVGTRPPGRLLLDRIDNSRGYEPGNVRWTDYKTQQRNKRSNVYIKYKGQDRLLVEVCEEVNIHVSIVRTRLKLGWDVEDALTIPSHRGYWSYAKHKQSRSNSGDRIRRLW